MTMTKARPSFRVGVDIGGTFTDIVLIGEDGKILTQKISSSVDDYSRSIAEGLATLFAQGFDLFDAVEDDLTMHGLVLISRYNKELETE
jgi:predicted NBD/HSP70 family sugar kinase